MTETDTCISRYFPYRDGSLYADGVDLKTLAETYGTPTYIYSQRSILDAYQGYEKGLDGIPHLIAFAVKANGNIALLNLLARQGAGADLTSGGEMFLAEKGGIPANRMIFSGVGKSETEIRQAIDTGILMLNVESAAELRAISEIAKSMGKTAPIAIRVNPNIDPKTHPKITTGLKNNKFGVPWEQAEPLYEEAAGLSNITVRGIAAHIGSSLADTTPLLHTLERLLALYEILKGKGIAITHLDIGGGLGIRYDQESPDTPEVFAAKVKEMVGSAPLTLVTEPGRSIIGNAGILLCKVTYVKQNDEHRFAVVDAGMNDLARPAIYNAYHRIDPVILSDDKQEPVDIVGPICESSDVFGKKRLLPPCKAGDLLAIGSAGAYGFAMASYYNGRVRPAEVLVNGNEHRLIRKRETYDDLLRHQVLD